MNKVAGAVILMLLPALVEAEPVYLECNLNSGYFGGRNEIICCNAR